MSSEEFGEWQAFYKMEPFGARADYVGFAMVACAIVNSTYRGKDAKMYKVEDFMPKDGPEKPMSGAAMKAFASAITIGLGGEVRE
jgi:hypothetical protein